MQVFGTNGAAVKDWTVTFARSGTAFENFLAGFGIVPGIGFANCFHLGKICFCLGVFDLRASACFSNNLTF